PGALVDLAFPAVVVAVEGDPAVADHDRRHLVAGAAAVALGDVVAADRAIDPVRQSVGRRRRDWRRRRGALTAVARGFGNRLADSAEARTVGKLVGVELGTAVGPALR